MNVIRIRIDNILWILILLILFFQCFLQKYSIISNVALLFIAIKQYPKMSKVKKGYIGLAIVWIILMIGYSVLHGNQVDLAARFGVIIFFILASYFWKTNIVFLKALYYISFFLVIGLIGLEIYMFSLSESEYTFLRDHFFIANDMGDVFWWGIYYKLELRGTPLVVFVYMLSYVADIFPNKYRKVLRILYFVAVVFAGNFAYQLALVLFHLLYYIQSSLRSPQLFMRRFFLLFVFSLFVGGVLLAYLSSQMETKKEGSAQARYDQVEVLLDDMAQSPLTVFLGSGLGHTVNAKTSVRDYREATYFEVQTIYFFNQLGLVNFTIFILINFILAFRYIKHKELILVYSVYAAYASTNPYIWDTNHVVVITSLLCAKSLINSTRNDLQSRMVVVHARNLWSQI